jgi:hypothetical protein
MCSMEEWSAEIAASAHGHKSGLHDHNAQVLGMRLNQETPRDENAKHTVSCRITMFVPGSIRKRGISTGRSKIPEVDVIFVATDM